ncbi:putative LysR family transcriptional regulator [Agrobacterium rubi TR3 = NBRC 13261]|uniref:HTH-type transcriptional regulator TtuA n=1 Tax=Agrobacterium rubi TR3 = NBRC 13261 TaxID=1368415 RepID=A0A081D2Y3_9HYPH|nr:LysR family transcriptional regulator [Agrobacterium rubi]MBP1881486.1 DNA-binding transcriptional LysR family regulator [Agrobacterium rubi]GAK73279.1 putative LysR family transcriptional regulator [Agrobacterium rubi TR3 = NBRC 13261]
MDRLDAMGVLLSVVEHGSLSAASRALHSPLPTVSRKISELESLLGVRLFTRTSRRMLLTEAGQSYVSAAREILERVEEAERRATGEYVAPKGDLTMTAPIVFGRLHVLPVVTDFLKAFPDININLIMSDRPISLADEHIDVALRISRLSDSSLMAIRLGSTRTTVYANPDYLKRHSPPSHPDELKQHDCIAFEGVLSTRFWTFHDGAKDIAVPIRTRLSVNTAEAAVDAAASGLGITRVMAYQAKRAVDAGLLVPLLEDFEREASPVHLVHLSDGLMPLKLRTFLDFATPRLRALLK